ncbi:MAG: hypothetical protein K9G70_01015 [Prolixibacteraceae bacterium]|nr:hypothetical protein [Prolixibacteraceae bacterium]
MTIKARTIVTIATITIFILFSALSLPAKNKYHVGLSMGSVIPIAEFGSNNPLSNTSGFAKPGFTMNFDGDYFIHNRLALSARFHFGQTTTDNDATYNWLKNASSNYITENNDSLRNNIGNWYWSSPLVGIKVNYPIVMNKIYIDGGIFSGLNISNPSLQRIRIINKTTKKETFSENNSSAIYSTPIMLDAGIRVILNKNIQLKAQSSYYRAKSNYEHYIYSMSPGASDIEELESFNVKKTIETINLTFGLIYIL